MAPPAGQCWNRPPRLRLFCFLLERVHQPVLRVLDDDGAQFTDCPVPDERTRLPRHEVSREGVHQAEQGARPRGDLLKLLAFLRHQAKGLLADHVNPLLQEGLRGRIVIRVRCADVDEVDAVGSHSLAFGHLFRRLVDAIFADTKLSPDPLRLLIVVREHAGHERRVAVQPEGVSMDLANAGAITTTDHSVCEIVLRLCHSNSLSM